MVSKMANIPERVEKIEKTNVKLENDIEVLEEESTSLETRMNDIEQ